MSLRWLSAFSPSDCEQRITEKEEEEEEELEEETIRVPFLFFPPIFFFIAFARSSTAQEVNFIKSCGLTAFSREDSRRDVTIHAT